MTFTLTFKGGNVSQCCTPGLNANESQKLLQMLLNSRENCKIFPRSLNNMYFIVRRQNKCRHCGICELLQGAPVGAFCYVTL